LFFEGVFFFSRKEEAGERMVLGGSFFSDGNVVHWREVKEVERSFS